jgi:rod shape-determining protein MreD
MRALIGFSFLIAFILMVIPIEFEWRWFRPEFIVLLVIYWSMFAPQYFGLIAAWSMGLIQDLLEFSPLGFNALGMMVIAYISHLVYQRIRNYLLWHQALWVFVLVGVFQVFSNWIGGFMGKSVSSPVFLIAAAISAFLWPLLVVIFGRLMVRFRLIQ